uniref:R13L1/DRL21-like LRR repeat region domain-containing protein n=1 Tax=Oryza punctata TaxID=4537 RepID=A0A0E0LLF6_ORYPU
MDWENKYVMRDLLGEQTAHVYRDELYHATERDRGKRILGPHQVIDISNFDVQFDSSKASKLRSMVLGLRGCHFKSLPTRMNQLINLRCLHTIFDRPNRESYEEFVVSERNRMVELRNLNQLGGQLCIANLEKASQTADAAEAELCRKIHLRRLVLKLENPISSDSDDCMSILEGLEPPKEIKELKIQGNRGFIFPKWAGMGQDFKYLHHIHVSHCEKLECLPPLGLLPALEIILLVSLPSIKQIDNAFYGDKKTVFKSLKELTFHSMLAWEK